MLLGVGCGKKGWPEPCTFVLPGTLRSQRFTWPWLQLRIHFRPFHGHLYRFSPCGRTSAGRHKPHKIEQLWGGVEHLYQWFRHLVL